MHRVVCNRCKQRGHFGRNCPNKDFKLNKAETFETAVGEAEAEAARALRRGDVQWVKFHDDELQRSQQRNKKAPARRREGSPRATPNPHREARFAGRYTACAVQDHLAWDDKLLRAERARYLRGCSGAIRHIKYRSARNARTINYRGPVVHSTGMQTFGA